MASLSTTPKYHIQLELPNNINLTNNLYKEKISQGNPKKDSGFDLFCPEDVEIRAGEIKLIDMKIKCAVYKNGEPSAYYMYSRSSTPIKYGLILGNSVGIIDSGYRGDAGIKLYNLTSTDYEGTAGYRIAQFVVYTNHNVIVTEGDVVESERGEKGFGSSGK